MKISAIAGDVILEIKKASITDIKPNDKANRVIKDKNFKDLVSSIKKFPETLKARPIVVDKDNIIITGAMSYKACIEAGIKNVYIADASFLTEEQKKEFIAKDNVGNGDWDYDLLSISYALDGPGEFSVPYEDLKGVSGFDASGRWQKTHVWINVAVNIEEGLIIG